MPYHPLEYLGSLFVCPIPNGIHARLGTVLSLLIHNLVNERPKSVHRQARAALSVTLGPNITGPLPVWVTESQVIQLKLTLISISISSGLEPSLCFTQEVGMTILNIGRYLFSPTEDAH
jgi:hypothetical protein